MKVENYVERRIDDNVVLCTCVVDGEYREYKKYSPAVENNPSVASKDTPKKKTSYGNSDSVNPIVLDREKVAFETETYSPDFDDDLDR